MFVQIDERTVSKMVKKTDLTTGRANHPPQNMKGDTKQKFDNMI